MNENKIFKELTKGEMLYLPWYLVRPENNLNTN